MREHLIIYTVNESAHTFVYTHISIHIMISGVDERSFAVNTNTHEMITCAHTFYIAHVPQITPALTTQTISVVNALTTEGVSPLSF